MIVVTGHVRIAPEAVEALRPHMQRMLEESRKEDGCLLYAYGEDVLDPGLIRVVERWRDWESLAAHGRAPHMAPWRQALTEIGVLDRDIAAHEAGAEKTL